MTDTRLLREKIQESGLKYKYLAEKLGISGYSLQKKIDNRTEFKACEIKALCCILGIDSLPEKEKIFFAGK